MKFIHSFSFYQLFGEAKHSQTSYRLIIGKLRSAPARAGEDAITEAFTRSSE
jgi:hypothetical protein